MDLETPIVVPALDEEGIAKLAALVDEARQQVYSKLNEVSYLK